MKKYYEEMDILRGVAILLVLLGHSIILFPVNLMGVSWCKTLYNYIYYFHMPLFFVIAGFCYSNRNNYNDYISTKIKRILIPYVIFGVIDLIPRHIFPQVINGNNSLKNDIISIIFLGGQYWFLYVLFIIFLIFPFIEKTFKNKFITGLILVILVILQFFNITDWFLIDAVLKYLFYFVVGFLLKRVYSYKITEIMSKIYIVISLFVLFILVGLAPNNAVTEIIKAIIGCAMAYSFVVCTKINKINDVLKDYGKYSLQIYLLNGFMLVPARIVIVKVLNITNPLVIIVTIFIFNALIGLLISKYIINKVNIFKLLCGIKVKKEVTS